MDVPVQALRHPHMGLGYLLIVTGLIVLLWSWRLASQNEELEGTANVIFMIYVGLLDFQALLGVGLFFVGQFPFSGRWMLHPLCMVAAAICAHIGKKSSSWGMVGWFLVSLVLLLSGAYPVTSLLG